MMNKLVTFAITIFLVIIQGGSTMSNYNIQMGQRNADNTEWDNYYPITKEENIIGSSQYDNLANILNSIMVGTSKSIGMYGDSTQHGFTWSGIANPTAAQNLQTILRDYYGNTAATVNNYGVDSTGTNSNIATWESTMAADTNDILYINFCINDANGTTPNPAITAEQYKANLMTMVKTARKYNKVVVLQTPNAVIAGGLNVTLASAQKIKQFADTMRQVAYELNVPLVDIQYWTEKYLAVETQTLDYSIDGLHPTQAVYDYMSLLLAQPLISPKIPTISKTDIIPCNDPNVMVQGSTYVSCPASIVGELVAGRNIQIPFLVDTTGLDIYLATAIWAGGDTSCNIKLDKVLLDTINSKDSSGTTNYIVDQEIKVVENIRPGFHILEISANSTDAVGVNYLRAYPTDKRTQIGNGTFEYKKTVLDNITMSFTGASYNHILTDINTSRFLKKSEVEITATLGGNEGFFLFGHKMGPNAGLQPWAGVLMWVSPTNGHLQMAEGTGDGITYTSLLEIGSVDLRAAQHIYKLSISTNGTITFYVDGTLISTQTMAKSYQGGFLGFWKSGTGNVTINKVVVTQ